MEFKKVFLIIFSLFSLGIFFSLMNKNNHHQKREGIFSGDGVKPYSRKEEGSEGELKLKKSAVKPKILVHISGAIRYPGLYEVSFGTRSIDLIKEAGGVLSQADLNKVNFANRLRDGQHIYVPFVQSEKTKRNVKENEKEKIRKRGV